VYTYIFYTAYIHRAISAVNSQSECDMTNVSSARGVCKWFILYRI